MSYFRNYFKWLNTALCDQVCHWCIECLCCFNFFLPVKLIFILYLLKLDIMLISLNVKCIYVIQKTDLVICILVFDYILQRLALCYTNLSQAYTKTGEVINSGRRLLGKYFRVGFYGVRIFIINEIGSSFYLLVNKNFNWKIPRKPSISKCQLRWDILYEKQKNLFGLIYTEQD